MTDDPDKAALGDQRDFLLRSLEDLEREHEVGDVDEHDYAALKDDYTARAAQVLRALDAEHPRVATTPPPPRRRRLATAAGIGVFALVAGLLVAHVAGRRDPGQTVSGGTRQSVTESLNTALQDANQGSYPAALDQYAKVLKAQPTNVEALTYKGWVLTLSGNVSDGLTSLLQAAKVDPKYPDVHAFLAVVFFRTGLVQQSAKELDLLGRLDPPPDIKSLTDSLRTQVQQALATAPTSTTLAPTTTAP